MDTRVATRGSIDEVIIYLVVIKLKMKHDSCSFERMQETPLYEQFIFNHILNNN